MSNVKNTVGLYSGKLALNLLNTFNKSGTALPGKIALTIDHNILESVNQKCDKIILITGTNGKTTTNNLTNHIINNEKKIILSNLKGANMIQGLVSAYIRNTQDHYDYGIFEVDEGSLNKVVQYLKPDYIIITNFFRDQLDRFGEIEDTVDHVYNSVKQVPETKLILNTDDPLINKFKTLPNKYITFGLKSDNTQIENEILTLKNCPQCGSNLKYNTYTYSHLGDYECTKCNFKRGKSDYTVIKTETKDNSRQLITIQDKNNNTHTINYGYIGIYNAYNICGVYALCDDLNIKTKHIIQNMENFEFSLGRMEEMKYKNKTIKIILTKNPTGLTQSAKIISEDKRKKSIVQILNDNPADGCDTSWIWDANTQYQNPETIQNYYCSGKRSEDIAIRMKYENIPLNKIKINDNMQQTINTAIEDDIEILYVLPTYTAIFETRDYIEKITQHTTN